jgi:predicted transcriptional regulator
MEEHSSFVRLFGDYPIVRVIDFMLTYREFDYPLTEIAENSGVAWSTIHTFFQDLVKKGIVVPTRQVGRAKMFKLNTKSKIVQELIKLDNKLIHELAEEMTSEKIVARN